jgi:hypothetical protein
MKSKSKLSDTFIALFKYTPSLLGYFGLEFFARVKIPVKRINIYEKNN